MDQRKQEYTIVVFGGTGDLPRRNTWAKMSARFARRWCRDLQISANRNEPDLTFKVIAYRRGMTLAMVEQEKADAARVAGQVAARESGQYRADVEQLIKTLGIMVAKALAAELISRVFIMLEDPDPANDYNPAEMLECACEDLISVIGSEWDYLAYEPKALKREQRKAGGWRKVCREIITILNDPDRGDDLPPGAVAGQPAAKLAELESALGKVQGMRAAYERDIINRPADLPPGAITCDLCGKPHYSSMSNVCPSCRTAARGVSRPPFVRDAGM